VAILGVGCCCPPLPDCRCAIVSDCFETCILRAVISEFCAMTTCRSRSFSPCSRSRVARLFFSAEAPCFLFFGRHVSQVALPLNSVRGFHLVQLEHLRRSGELRRFKILQHADWFFCTNRMPCPSREDRSAFARVFPETTQILQV